jgi:hypothetical protein
MRTEVLTPLQERELSWHCPGQFGVASEVRPVRHDSAAAAHRAYQGSIQHWMSQGRVHSCTRSSTTRRYIGIRQDTSLRRQRSQEQGHRTAHKHAGKSAPCLREPKRMAHTESTRSPRDHAGRCPQRPLPRLSAQAVPSQSFGVQPAWRARFCIRTFLLTLLGVSQKRGVHSDARIHAASSASTKAG